MANRLLIIACLAKGKTHLYNMPINDDIEQASLGIQNVGADIIRHSSHWTITGTGGKLCPTKSIYTGENGTFSRFVVSLISLNEKTISIDSAPAMKTRPMADILLALTQLGVRIESSQKNFPIKITGPLQTGEVSLPGNISSQYFSSLLLSLPYAQIGQSPISRVMVKHSLVSKNYIDLTCQLMEEFGIKVKTLQNKNSITGWEIPRGAYRGMSKVIQGDPVSATYFMGIAALSQQSIIIKNYPMDTCQGEKNFLLILEKMGCFIHRAENSGQEIRISGPPKGKKMQAIDINMKNMPDAVPTLAVIASNAEGTTTIKGISHIRYKESNRIEKTALELSKVGIKVKTGSDWISISGGSIHSATLNSHNDHRLAMSLSLLSIHAEKITIHNFQTINKSFPTYPSMLKKIGFTFHTHHA